MMPLIDLEFVFYNHSHGAKAACKDIYISGYGGKGDIWTGHSYINFYI